LFLQGCYDIIYPKERGDIKKAAVRYFSRSGNTEVLARAIADAAGVSAVSVDSSDAALSGPQDVLFIGGALYAYGIDSKLKEYLKTLKKEDAALAVIFSTSWISKHAVDLIRKGLTEAGIPVAEEFFHVKNRPNEKQLEEAAAFARRFLH